MIIWCQHSVSFGSTIQAFNVVTCVCRFRKLIWFNTIDILELHICLMKCKKRVGWTMNGIASSQRDNEMRNSNRVKIGSISGLCYPSGVFSFLLLISYKDMSSAVVCQPKPRVFVYFVPLDHERLVYYINFVETPVLI